ncbi:MAG: hypothetical protein HRT53_13040 [Colwellia sp.]|nr:hypothetical protein [Colwellia sp.]
MKKLGIFTLVLFLFGCTTKNYQQLEISSATVSNLDVEEIVKPNKGIYKLDVKFNYVINDFNEGSGIYSCSVQFLTVKEHISISSFVGPIEPCRITTSSGEMMVRLTTPLDKTQRFLTERQPKIQRPIQYFLAIHQQTGKQSSKIIGKTAIQTFDIKI